MKQYGLDPKIMKPSPRLPRFSEVNPKVGQLISLNNRLILHSNANRPSISLATGGEFDNALIGTIQTAVDSNGTVTEDFNSQSK